MTKGIGMVLVGVVLVAALDAQTFEVASVRPVAPGVVPPVHAGVRGYRTSHPPGRFVARGWSLLGLIAYAYALPQRTTGEVLTLQGGEARLLARAFDIEALLPSERVSLDEDRAMLRALLTDRFGLRIHLERQRMPVYALRPKGDGLGPGLKRGDMDCVTWWRHRLPRPQDADGNRLCDGGNGFEFESGGFGQRLQGQGDIAALIQLLQGYVDRPVVDETGLTGHFAWNFTFAPLLDVPRAREVYPSVFTAVKERLHLELAPTEAAVNVVVIDAVSEPEPN